MKGTVFAFLRRHKILSIFMIFMLLVAGIILFLHSPPGRNLVLNQVQSILKNQYGIQLDAGSLRFNLLNLSASIESLNMDTDNEELPIKRVSAEYIQVNMGMRTLLSGMLHFQNIQIDHPNMVFRSPTPSEAAQKTPGSSPPLHIRVDNLNIKQGRIEYKDQSASIYADLSRIRFDIHYDTADKTHAGLFSAEKGNVRFQEINLPVDHIHLPFRFDMNSFELQGFHLDSNVLTFKASGKIKEYQKTPHFDLTFSAAIQSKNLSETLNLNQSLQGTIHLEGQMVSSADGPRMEGNLSVDNFFVSGIPLSSLRAEIDYQPTRLKLNQLRLESLWGELNASGTWFKDAAETSQINLQWDKLQPDFIYTQMRSQPPPIISESRGRLHAQWTTMELNHLNASLEAEFGSFSDSGRPSDLSGRINAEWNQGTAVVYPSRFSFPGGELNLNGRMDTEQNIQAKMDLNVRDFSRLLSRLPQDWVPVPVNGALALSAGLQGSLSQPEIELNLDSQNLSIRSFSVSHLTASIAHQHNTLSIREFLIQSGEGKIHVSGEINPVFRKLALGHSSHLEFAVSKFALGPVVQSFLPKLAIAGQLDGNGSFTGSLQHPQVNFNFTAAPLNISGENLDSLSVEGSYQPEQISLEQLNVIKNKASLSGSAEWRPVPQIFKLALNGNGIRIQDFALLSRELQSCSGTIDFELNAGGPLACPEGGLSLALTNAAAKEVRVGDVLLDAQSDGDNLSAELYTGDKSIQIRAVMPLEHPKRVQAQVHINQWNIGAHLPPKPGSQGPMPPFSTQVTAAAEMTISLEDPRNFSGDFQMSSLKFAYRGIQFTLPQPISVNAENGIIFIQDFVFSGPQTEIRAGGTFPIHGKPRQGVSLSGNLNLNAFEPFISGAHLAGTIAVKTSISGTLQNPELSGNIRIQDVEAGYNGFPFSLKKVKGDIILNSGMLRLDHFSAAAGGGEIQADGRFEIPGLNKADSQPDSNEISLKWHDLNPAAFDRFLPPEYSGRLQGEISGSASASGDFTSLDAMTVQGRFNRLWVELTPFQLAAEKDILFSMSEGHFQLQPMRLSGSQSWIEAQGILDLNPKEPRIDGTLTVSLDGGALSPLMNNVLLSGTAGLDLSVEGPLNSPVINGTGSIQDIMFQLQAAPLNISNLSGDIHFSKSKINISSLEGSANGGPVTLSGQIDYSQLNLERLKMDLDFSQLQWNYPEGLDSINRGNITMQLSGGEWTLSGDVRIQQAYFNKDIYIGTQLINQIRLNQVRMQTEMPEFLKQLNLDIQIRTEGEAVIDNNLAELGLNINLVIQGSPNDPAISGLVSNPFSGKITFGDRNFQVERAHINFPGGDILDARVHITAHTSMRDEREQLDITLSVSGPLTDLNTSLTSFPTRSEVQLASLILTGRSLDRLKSGTANVITNQLLFYFATPLASTVTNQIEDWLQVEEVRIEPINISTEEDPGARFTFRKGLTRNVDLIYSVDITDTQDQTWILEYGLSRNFIIRTFRKDDASYGSSLEHRFELGKPKYIQYQYQNDVRRNILETVRISGELGFPEKELRTELGKLKPGQVFNYSDLLSASDHLKKYYTKRNYLNAVINPRISYGDDHTIQIDIHISSGMPVFLDYMGDPVSNDMKQDLRHSWNGRLPETARISEASQKILNQMKGKGYYQAEVRHEKKSTRTSIQHIFTINRGSQFEIRRFHVEGSSAVTTQEIHKMIKNLPGSQEFGLWNLVRSFPKVQEQLKNLYQEQGYMNARIHPPRVIIRSSGREIDITLPIEQGKQSRVERLDFQGLETFTSEELKKNLNLVPQRVFRPSQLAMDINYLIDQYRSQGFQDIEIDARLEYQENRPDVSLIYSVSEGIVHHIQSIVISGNLRTPEKVIRRELVFEAGQPVIQSQIVESQKNLYDLDIFDLVNIQRKKIPDKPEQEQILVEVREMPLFFLGYGLRYDSDDRLEVFGNLHINNLFGRSRNGILFYRQNKWEKNFRFSLTDPYFLGLPLNTLHSIYLMNEERAGLVTDESGYTVEQRLRLPFSATLSYLYRLNHIHTYDLESTGPFAYDISWWLSEVSTHIIRDTRSNKLNARTGSFFSLSLTYSPEFLGSTFTYIRGFGQYSFFFPLYDKFTLASNVRIGLGDTLKQTIMIPSKRFYAGGGNSIRGFEKDQVGPYNRYLGRPDGGEALFIINQELRFPIYKSFSGAAFFDAGNIYRNIEDFNPLDLRTSAGLGLRFNSPVGLLRLDYGINLSPESREPRTVIFFSIGQAF